jgi:hypothetical protein
MPVVSLPGQGGGLIKCGLAGGGGGLFARFLRKSFVSAVRPFCWAGGGMSGAVILVVVERPLISARESMMTANIDNPPPIRRAAERR